MVKRIEISYKTIVFTVLFLLFLWVLFLIRDLILQIFVALLIMTILNPLVTKLSRVKIPRAVSVLLVYLLVFGLFGFVFGSLVNPLIDQTTSFVNSVPEFLKSSGISRFVNGDVQNQIISQLGSLPGKVIMYSVSFFSNVLNFISVLIIAFYLLLARDRFDSQLQSLFGEERQKKFASFLNLLENRLGGWARGQLALMFLVGVAIYIGLLLLKIPFALPLALFAGLFEMVPYLGPILSAVPAVLIGFSISPVMGVIAIVLYFVVQQLENYLFVPKIMEKSVGVSPVVTILALAIGLRLAGIIGILIAVPVVITLQVTVQKYFNYK